MEEVLKIENLHVEVDGKMILKGVNLTINKGEIHVLMGKNGTGKSTLMYTIMGHPDYIIKEGRIFFEGNDITEMETHERARMGIFLSFQNPEEIAGIKTTDFLRFASTKVLNEQISSINFSLRVAKEIEKLNMKKDMQSRYLNVGFSGGEKKKNEILQLSILKPKFAMLDEVDSGLDVDATRDVEDAIIRYFDKEKAILMISHHSEMVHRVKPNFVHILANGVIERTGDNTLIDEIQKYGYGDRK